MSTAYNQSLELLPANDGSLVEYTKKTRYDLLDAALIRAQHAEKAMTITSTEHSDYVRALASKAFGSFAERSAKNNGVQQLNSSNYSKAVPGTPEFNLQRQLHANDQYKTAPTPALTDIDGIRKAIEDGLAKPGSELTLPYEQDLAGS